MRTIAALWQNIETQYNSGTFSADQFQKIDVLVFSDDIENIRNGLTLMTTIAPEYLCRYLELDGESVVLRDAARFSAPLSAERVLVESAKDESMWQDLYESGAFDLMALRALDMALEDLSESEKEFCVRMTKEMVRLPDGEFMLETETSLHKVTLTRDFLMGKYLVTQALWESVMGSNPSDFKGANRPVEKVSWFDVVSFCNKLSELEGLEPAYGGLGDYQVGDDQNMDENEIESLSAGITCNWNAKGYRLPTHAEWLYSARSGQQFKYPGSNSVDEVAWYRGNSLRETHPVGQKKSNGFGLYDMSGNVCKWIWDWYGDYRPKNLSDLVGPSSGSERMVVGGSGWDREQGMSLSVSGALDPEIRRGNLGFRLARLP